MRLVIPRMRLDCGISRRQKAGRLIAAVRRAARAGNCSRAERILDDREYSWATQCVAFSTQARVHRLVQKCRERYEAA